MKYLLFNGYDDLRFLEEAIYDEFLVKVTLCGICTGELMEWYVKSKSPYTPGHEIVGRIIKLPEHIHNFSIGDRVFVHHHGPCMQCIYCKREEYTSCDIWRKNKIYPGGFSEIISVPENIYKTDILKIPDFVSDEDAALIEPLACSVKAIRKLKITYLDKVAVIGLGFMGLLNAKLLKQFGVGKVVGFDFYENRRSLGINWSGLDEVFHPENFDYKEKFNIVVVGPPSIDAIRFSLKIVDRGGKIILFAPTPPSETLDLDVNYIYFNEISIIPSYSSGPLDTRIALNLIVSGLIRPSELITHRFNFNEIDQAFKTAKKPEAIKVIVKMGGEI
ncbi:MAG: alcohol dehydrogenase catalytic domain-containing protein [candidate division WOR-3 bacterium]|nr:alcohol dehydrogenase catalytic domain-containing protein [candidate division WOR-3 bacterium]